MRYVLRTTLRTVASNPVGGEVDVAGHLGDSARRLDVVATERMRSAVRDVFGGHIRFEAEDTPRGGRPITESFVWQGDALDGTRQRNDLGFGYASAASLHGLVDDG
ncbi:MAG: hypothetical protein MI921_11465, partial [Cytophagales bacterium]|nr:hypothetical protein [Cytophagales bacterium]